MHYLKQFKNIEVRDGSFDWGIIQMMIDDMIDRRDRLYEKEITHV